MKTIIIILLASVALCSAQQIITGTIVVNDEERHARMLLEDWLAANCTNMEAETITANLTRLDIRLDTITNWTSIQHDGQELGYVATNHIAVVYYQGAMNEFLLKTTTSEIAKWRKLQPPPWIWVSNIIVTLPQLTTTNEFH